MIGKLLGDRQVQTAARYARSANESVKASGSRRGPHRPTYRAPTSSPSHPETWSVASGANLLTQHRSSLEFC